MATATHTRPTLKRGDTALSWTIDVAIDQVAADIASAAMQFRLGRRLVAAMTTAVVGGKVTIEEVAGAVTADWPLGVLHWDLELTLADGRIVTWLEGTQKIVKDYTYGA